MAVHGTRYVCKDGTLGFDGSDSYDNDENQQSIVYWDWDVYRWTGSGYQYYTTFTGEITNHTFTVPGYYQIELVVWDDEGDPPYSWDTDFCYVAVAVGEKILIEDLGHTKHDVTGQTITLLKGSGYWFEGQSNVGGWPDGSPIWSGACQDSGSAVVFVDFPTAGTTALNVSCCSEPGPEVTIYVVEPIVYQVSFYGDHTLYKEPNASEPDAWGGWGDGTVPITDLVYDSDTGEKDPVCVTKNQHDLHMDAVLKVPSALSYGTYIKVDASGTEEWNESQEVGIYPITSAAASLSLTGTIIERVHEYAGDFAINWKYKVPEAYGNGDPYPVESTCHTVYVTYGTPSPSGNEVTVRRIGTLCGWADWQCTRKAVADQINANLVALPFGHKENKQTDDWDLMWIDPDDPEWTLTGKQGECDEQARFMVRCLDLIGVDGSLSYNTYASVDTEVYDDQDSKEVGGEVYWLVFDADEDGIADNYFEGSVKVATNDAKTTFHYYTVVGPKIDAPTDCLLWRKLGPDYDNWKQVWVYSETGFWEDVLFTNYHLPGWQSYASCP